MLQIVPHFDVLEVGTADHMMRDEGVLGEEFVFERGEQPLDDRIVPAVAPAAHAAGDALRGKSRLVRHTRVLTAPIGLMHQRVLRHSTGEHPIETLRLFAPFRNCTATICETREEKSPIVKITDHTFKQIEGPVKLIPEIVLRRVNLDHIT